MAAAEFVTAHVCTSRRRRQRQRSKDTQNREKHNKHACRHTNTHTHTCASAVCLHQCACPEDVCSCLVCRVLWRAQPRLLHFCFHLGEQQCRVVRLEGGQLFCFKLIVCHALFGQSAATADSKNVNGFLDGAGLCDVVLIDMGRMGQVGVLFIKVLDSQALPLTLCLLCSLLCLSFTLDLLQLQLRPSLTKKKKKEEKKKQQQTNGAIEKQDMCV